MRLWPSRDQVRLIQQILRGYPQEAGIVYAIESGEYLGAADEERGKGMKPRNKLCWLCGRKFRGNHFTEIEIDGHMRELHKECAKNPKFWYEIKGARMDNERHAIDEDAAKLAAKLLGARGGRKSRNTIPPEQQERMQAAKKAKYAEDPRKGKKIGHMFNCRNPRCRGGCNKRKFDEGV